MNRNMKGKFKLLGHIGLMLFLVSALMLAVAPVAHATAVTDVWVEFAATSANATSDTDHDNVYYVHFKPNTALERGVDTVTVYWPDGSIAMGGDGTSSYAFTVDDDTGTTDATLCLSPAEVSFSTDFGTTVDTDAASPAWTDCTLAGTSAGYRTKVTTPIDIAAGQDVWIKFDSDATDDTLGIESASTEGVSYKVKVSTSKDTTAVLSSTFALGDSSEVCSALTAEVVTSTAGAPAQYIFSITCTNAVSANTGKVTVKFPVGTTVPTSIAATSIQFSTDAGSNYSTCAEAPVVDSGRRMITAVTPVELGGDANNRMKILSSANVQNPQIAASASNAYYKAMVRTTADDQWLLGSAYAITEGSASKVAVANGEIGLGSVLPYSDSATMVNMLSSYIYVYIADQYGNAVDTSSASVTVTPGTSSTSGAFYANTADSPGSGTYSTTTSITVDNEDPTDAGQQVYYLDSTAGTHTLTFEATGYEDATWTITVAPVISLYDSNNNLVSTFGATASSPVAEIAASSGTGSTQKYSVDYITDAISAAMVGDTIKLGNGIYELDTYINLNKKITLTSASGASYTTIKPISEPLGTQYASASDIAIVVGTDGTAANPVVIDGITFTRLRYGTEFDEAIWNNSYDYVTVSNCVFDYIVPDVSGYADHEYGAVVQFLVYDAGAWTGDNITSATISNNTFTNCCTFGFNAYGEQHANISVMSKTGGTTYTITGVTVSGNTLTNCNGVGIWLKGYTSNETVRASVWDNTITNVVYPISIGGYTTNISVLRNTITGGYQCGIWVEFTNHDSLVIKNNTITDCAGTGTSSYNYSAAVLLWDDGGDTDEVTLQYNAIYDNDATYGIYVMSDIAGGAQNCQYNWYGDASGPYYSALTGATIAKSNPNGTGEAITDRATYYPWLHKPLTDVVADNASYQASAMKLVEGWNTLSTPVKLIDSANSIDELIPSGMTIGYWYDAFDADSDGSYWEQITTGYTLSPCDAVYVKMNAATYVQLKFDAGSFSTPSKALAAGWNLISLAALDSDGMEADDAVASVYLTSANLPGYGQVVSPSLNPNRYDMYYNVGTNWTVSRSQHATSLGTSYHMYAGMGYWIYMQNAATLAGFEITPIAPDLD